MIGGVLQLFLLLLLCTICLVCLFFGRRNVEKRLSLPPNGANNVIETRLAASTPSSPPPGKPQPTAIAAAAAAAAAAATTTKTKETTASSSIRSKVQSLVLGKQGSITRPASELNLVIMDKATVQYLAQFRTLCSKNLTDGFPRNANSRHHETRSKESSSQRCPCIPSTVRK